jgi:excisionase family DNA binding protein
MQKISPKYGPHTCPTAPRVYITPKRVQAILERAILRERERRRREPHRRFASRSRAAPKTDVADLPQFLTVEQVAEYLQVNKLTVYEAIRRGELRVVRFGMKRMYVPRAVFEQV